MTDKLEFLLALAREQHFGRAAEACGVTQPTLSAGIKQLEEGLGLLLVNRSARYRGPHARRRARAGMGASRIVGDSRAMRQEVRALKQGHLVGHLRLAAIPTALAMVSALTTPFRAKHPAVRFTIRVELVDRGAERARQSRDRRRHHLSRQRAAGPGAVGAALSRGYG